MNRTGIEYADATWNPISGCWGPGGSEDRPNRCWYCYARRMAGRLRGRAGYPADGDPFRPVFHRTRVWEPDHARKPRVILAGSMCDLWGPWVRDAWFREIVHSMWWARQHTYLLLTKHPKQYMRLLDHGDYLAPGGRLPPNWWAGTTITGEDADVDLARLSALSQVGSTLETTNLWVSVEPYLQSLHPDAASMLGSVGWVVIGPLTGRAQPAGAPGHVGVSLLLGGLRASAPSVPIFMKAAGVRLWNGRRPGANAPQEVPW